MVPSFSLGRVVVYGSALARGNAGGVGELG